MGGPRDNLEKESYANGEIGAIEERSARCFDGFANFGQFIVPACSAGDGTEAEGGQAAKIFGSSGRRGKFDRGGGTDEGFAGERSGIAAGKAGDDMETVLRGKLLDEATHFAVADDGEWKAHAGGAPVMRSWRTMRE